jgi:hypothetical protein
VANTVKGITVNKSFCGDQFVMVVITSEGPIGTPPQQPESTVNTLVVYKAGVDETPVMVLVAIVFAVAVSTKVSRKFLWRVSKFSVLPLVIFVVPIFVVAAGMSCLQVSTLLASRFTSSYFLGLTHLVLAILNCFLMASLFYMLLVFESPEKVRGLFVDVHDLIVIHQDAGAKVE